MALLLNGFESLERLDLISRYCNFRPTTSTTATTCVQQWPASPWASGHLCICPEQYWRKCMHGQCFLQPYDRSMPLESGVCSLMVGTDTPQHPRHTALPAGIYLLRVISRITRHAWRTTLTVKSSPSLKSPGRRKAVLAGYCPPIFLMRAYITPVRRRSEPSWRSHIEGL